MFTMGKIFFQWLGILIVMTVSLAACQGINRIQNDSHPTQDVGEEPPLQISTQNKKPLSATATITQSGVNQPPAWLLGATPYPTSGRKVVVWEDLIDPGLVADIEWDIYQGEFRMNDASETWFFSFKYPSGWYIDPKADFTQVFVQNIPVTQEAGQSQAAKFEIVRLNDLPMIEEGHALDPNELITVEVAGELTIPHSTTKQLDQRRQIKAIIHHGSGWLVATGDIVLPMMDKIAMDKYASIIYAILSSFNFDRLANTTQQSMETLNPPDQKKPAISEFPAAGICEESQDNPVSINISAGSMPDPRCLKVMPDQQLEFTNETGAVVRIQLG